MLLRILTALVGIPIFLGLLYVGKWPLFALVAGMGLIGFHEYVRMWRHKGIQAADLLGAVAVLALITWAALSPQHGLYLGAMLAAIPMALLAWLLVRFRTRNVTDALVTFFGVVYVGWLLSHLLLLRSLGEGTGWDLGLRWVLFAFVGTWVADSFAYFIGRAFGRRKLLPAVSPNKSVEGAIGGGVATVITGWFLAVMVGISPWQGAAIGFGIFVLSVLGDLAESALKRYAGVKDSGSLIPGHGGVLDRFDSSLFVLPFVYYVARLFFVG
jgi:phosphatidate cytidylyltransferase